MLKTSLAIVACILIAAPMAAAQFRAPEVFVGYTNLQSQGLPDRNEPGWVFDTDFFRDRSTLHGVNVAVSGFSVSGIGLTGDISFSRQSNENEFVGGEDEFHTDTYYFLGGPTWKWNRGGTSRVEPFARLMAGAAHTRFNASTTTDAPGGGTNFSSFSVGSTDFAAALGGGLDLRLGEYAKLRLIQVDYTPVFLRDRTVDVLGGAGVIEPSRLDGQRQDNVRFSFGFVF